MTASTRAWILDVAAGWQFAVGSRHVIEYVLSPEASAIPLAPAHCQGMLAWRERLIPLVDLAALLAMQQTSRHKPRRAVILGYWDPSRLAVRYGALAVRTPPTDLTVSDDMACALPEEPAVIRHLCRSCFVHRDEIIPILDTARLFAQPLPLTLLPPDRADKEDIHGNEAEREVGPYPLSVARTAKTFLPGAHDEPVRPIEAGAPTTSLIGPSEATRNGPPATARMPVLSVASTSMTEGQHAGSSNQPSELTPPISVPETNISAVMNTSSVAMVAATMSNEIEIAQSRSALDIGQERPARPSAALSPAVARNKPFGAVSRHPRSSAFRESLERRNARREPPSSGVRRSAGYIALLIVVLAGALYGGLVWRDQVPQATEASRPTVPSQLAAPRPAPVSVPSAPVQPPE